MNTNRTSTLIRRFIAIGLTVFTLVFLFWPSMIRIANKDYRDMVEGFIPSYRRSLEDLRDNKSKYIDQLQHEYGDSEGTALYNATVAGLETSACTSWSFLSMRTRTTSSWTSSRIQLEHYGYTIDGESQDAYDKNVMYSILMNVTFFAILTSGVLAILLYALNKSRAGGIVLAALAVIGSAVFVFYIFDQNKLYDDALSGAYPDVYGVGPALFLLPIFAIAACIVYQRTPKRAAAADAPSDELWGMPPENAEKAPASAPYAPMTQNARQTSAARSGQPLSGSWTRPGVTPPPAPAAPNAPARAAINGWICPHCESDNPADVDYCPLCGSKKPVVRSQSFCTACGAPIDPGASFCSTCGAKQR